MQKKGLWVSEYRIESGLNCGGHTFATQGNLLGPILEEFKKKKEELLSNIHEIYTKTLRSQDKKIFKKRPKTLLTAQGGIGTYKENYFLLKYYKIDKTGWGTPFLLVPETTNVDKQTLKLLKDAKENDLYLSNISPLNVYFSNLKNSLSEQLKNKRIKNEKPGSPCPKGHLTFNTEFTEKPICIASRKYQELKIKQLNEKIIDKNKKEYISEYNKITEKSCLCDNLGNAVLLKYGIENDSGKFAPCICPGPNLSYFSKIISLKEMAAHIYGRVNILNTKYRPHMMINELKMYVDYFINEMKKCSAETTEKEITRLKDFRDNLLIGIEYYVTLFQNLLEETEEYRDNIIRELNTFKNTVAA